MDLYQPQDALHKYDVHVGHTRIVVEGRSRDEAIHHARRQLCLDIPRMWDVITQMDSSRFIVRPQE